MKIKKYGTYAKKSFVIIQMKEKIKLYKKVRDHCHFTGKFRGAAHSICNLHYKVPQEIPVKIHDGLVYIWKNILPFQFQLKKNMIMIMVKQSHSK